MIALLAILLCGCVDDGKKELELPKPQVSEGVRGDLGIDANVNEASLDKYLGRKDAVYRDMRMLIDPANYEAIGGDSYLSGFINGFEVVPYPFLAPTIGLPSEVGNGYTGDTLFSIENSANWIAGQIRTYTLENSTAYTYYRLNISNPQTTRGICGISMLNLINRTYHEGE